MTIAPDELIVAPDEEGLDLADPPPPSPQRRGTKAYFAAAAVAQVCALARYALLARFLGPHQLGIAATLILTSQFFEAVSDSGSDRFLIQDRDGDTPAVQKLVQLVFVSRGAFTATCLVVFALPLAILSGSKELALGFAVLSLAPLISGFLHLDIRRAQRHHDFRSEGAAMLAGEVSSLVVTVVAAWLTRSYVAILYGLIFRAAVVVLVSHLRAERRYALGFAKEHAARLARFALPLMANGLLLFFGSQGDRVMVANQLGLTELGRYSAVLLLIYYPSVVLTRFLAAMHLPRIAAHRDEPKAREQASSLLGAQSLLGAVAMSSGFALVAPLAVVILYGARFAMPAFLVGLIGVLQTGRFIRLWPNTAALAIGRSDVVLANNVARLVAIPAAIAGVVVIHGMAGVVVGFILGELVALLAAILLLNRARKTAVSYDLDRFALFAAANGCVLGWLWLADHPWPLGMALLAPVTIATAAWLVIREREAILVAVETARSMIMNRLGRRAAV